MHEYYEPEIFSAHGNGNGLAKQKKYWVPRWPNMVQLTSAAQGYKQKKRKNKFPGLWLLENFSGE